MFVAQVYPECSDKPTWPEEDTCDKTKDDAAAKDPVKAQIWDNLLYRHWDAFTGKKRSHVLVVDADGKNVRDLTPASAVGDAETPTFSLGGPLGYAWAPDSKEIAYVTNLDKVPAASTNNDVFTLRLDEPGAKSVKISTSLGSDDAPAYSPDGQYLAFRSQARAGFESDLFKLVVMDRQSGLSKELFHVHMDYSATGNGKESTIDRWVDEFIWSDDSKRLFFVAGDKGEEPIYSVDINGHELRRYGKAHGEWSSLSERRISGDLTMVGTLTSVDHPPEIALFNDLKMDDGVRTIKVSLNDQSPSKDVTEQSYVPVSLTNQNGALLNQIDLSKIESFWFTGAANTQVQGFLIRPPNFDPTKKYPLKFLMHGGPQTAWGDSWSYRWNWQLMAASGYVVIGINRRGSTGYGQKFVDEVSGDWGGKAYTDLMRGLDYAETKYPFIDKTRECALGASYGGYMADWVLTHTNRFKCIVTHDGMYDAESAYGSTEEMWFNEWEFRRSPSTGAAAFDPKPGQPWRYSSLPAAEDPFRKWSPSQYIQNAKTPTLIIHSQKDYRLDVSQGFELFTALQRLDVPSASSSTSPTKAIGC